MGRAAEEAQRSLDASYKMLNEGVPAESLGWVYDRVRESESKKDKRSLKLELKELGAHNQHAAWPRDRRSRHTELHACRM